MPAGKLRLNKVLKRPQQHILVNFIMKLPVSEDYDLNLVVYNRFLKISHFVATTKKITVKRLVKLFRDSMWKLYGLPESIISNKGPQFAAELMKELNEMLEIKMKLFIAYHLQIDRQTKRTN